MRESENERPEAHDEYSDAEVTRFTSHASVIRNGDEAKDGGRIVHGSDEAGFRTGQLEALLDGGDDDADEPVDDHTLECKKRRGECVKDGLMKDEWINR